MTDPHDETRPLPPAAGEPREAHPAAPEDATAPMPPARPGAPAEVPTWTNAADRPEPAAPAAPAEGGDASASGGNRPPGGVSGGRDVVGTPDPTPGSRRWSGRTTAVVVAAALGIGALGAAGAAAAVTRSDSPVREDVRGPGRLPGGGQGRLPGGGVAPDGGRGGLPAGPPPGGFDHDGDGDRHGTGDGDGDGGPGQRLPGPDDGTGSSDPGDANGADTALDT